MAEHERSEDPNLLLGLDAPDDAAVYRVAPDLALVQTVDFFTPVVDDPYAWGAIAAANALSDVYAMGGKPRLALNLVGWPMDLDFEILARVLEGGADKAAEAGVSIIGGHTVDDREPKYGMAVTGFVHPGGIVKSSGASPGLSLVITKPLSMGIVSTAIKRGEAAPALIEEATAIMTHLNEGAAEAMLVARAPAATDVTGFGLIGHLHQMARASGVGAEIWADAVPVMDGVLDLAGKGMVPGGTRRNEDYFSQVVDFDQSVSPNLRTILFDAQTSGGLLIAVTPGREDGLIEELRGRGTPAAHIIGRTLEGDGGRIRVAGSR